MRNAATKSLAGPRLFKVDCSWLETRFPAQGGLQLTLSQDSAAQMDNSAQRQTRVLAVAPNSGPFFIEPDTQ